MKHVQLKRFDIFNNGYVNSEHGKLCLYSEVDSLLRDEVSGAKVREHANPDPDGNEADTYTCITSNAISLCFTAKEIANARDRYSKAPWNTKPVAKKRKNKSKAKS